jgi:hypothetical protein
VNFVIELTTILCFEGFVEYIYIYIYNTTMFYCK